MKQQQLNIRNSIKAPFVWIIVMAILLIVGLLGGLAYLQHQNNPKAGNNSGRPDQIANFGGDMDSADCSGNGPCTNSSSGAPGCSGGGPCTQTSGGQTIISGKVTSASKESITIKPDIGGSSQTFVITSSTQQVKGGGAANIPYNVNDISVGDAIAIIPGSSNSNEAQLVMLNFNAQMETGSGASVPH